jgi:hypothetical protein
MHRISITIRPLKPGSVVRLGYSLETGIESKVVLGN